MLQQSHLAGDLGALVESDHISSNKTDRKEQRYNYVTRTVHYYYSCTRVASLLLGHGYEYFDTSSWAKRKFFIKQTSWTLLCASNIRCNKLICYRITMDSVVEQVNEEEIWHSGYGTVLLLTIILRTLKNLKVRKY